MIIIFFPHTYTVAYIFRDAFSLPFLSFFLFFFFLLSGLYARCIFVCITYLILCVVADLAIHHG